MADSASLGPIISDWATACGVLIALSFGVVAERRTFQDRKAQRELQLRAQASMVSAWLAAPENDQETAAVIVVENASREPVWDVVVAFHEIGRDDEDEWDEYPAEWRLGVLPPGARRRRKAPWTPPSEDEPVGVSFRDNGNRWWLRSEVGYLLPLSGDPHADS